MDRIGCRRLTIVDKPFSFEVPNEMLRLTTADLVVMKPLAEFDLRRGPVAVVQDEVPASCHEQSHNNHVQGESEGLSVAKLTPPENGELRRGPDANNAEHKKKKDHSEAQEWEPEDFSHLVNPVTHAHEPDTLELCHGQKEGEGCDKQDASEVIAVDLAFDRNRQHVVHFGGSQKDGSNQNSFE